MKRIQPQLEHLERNLPGPPFSGEGALGGWEREALNEGNACGGILASGISCPLGQDP